MRVLAKERVKPPVVRKVVRVTVAKVPFANLKWEKKEHFKF